MTASIDYNNPIMTLINVFTVNPDKQQQLINLLDAATEKAMKVQPGFISANITFTRTRTANVS